jgi:hypothetical protein
MKIGSGIVIGKDDAAGASAVRKPPEDRRPKFSNPNPESTNWYVVGVGICTSKTGQGRIAGKTGTDSW